MEALESRALLSTVTPLPSNAPNYQANTGTMMLETDGSVLLQGGNGGPTNSSMNWYRLAPDSSGSYVNGSWSHVASSSIYRLYYGSNVLPDGRVFIQGGEYSGPYGVNNEVNTGEIYNPVTNTWSNIATFPNSNFGDDPSEVLPNGTVLTGYLSGPQTYIYNPATNAWSPAGTKLRSDSSDEEAWVKLTDGSILSYDISASINTGVGHAQRYVPSTNTWVDAGVVPVQLSSTAVGYELGPGFLLPDGRAFYLGANGNTAYYTPSTNTWAAGPVIPNGLGADDAPGAELPDGNILFTADTPLFNGPAHLYEFSPTAGTYTLLDSLLPTNFLSGVSYSDRMLVLPSGQVLLNNSGNSSSSVHYVLFNPGVTPLPASVPTISGITENANGSFLLSGTGLNGTNEGASYGDDAEMSSNYPIVQLTDPAGKIYDARTFGWSSTGVATGATPESTNFSLPVGLPANTYTVTVVSNGIASSPFTLVTPTNNTDPAPTVAVAASAAPGTVTGTTTTLSALGADTVGESSLTYTWAATTAPSGAQLPSFSDDGTSSAKNDTVTFHQAGSYTFTVTMTNLAGLSTTSSVNVVVNQTFTSTSITPLPDQLAPAGTSQLTARAIDQFNQNLASQPAFTWSLVSGDGSLSSTGLFTAPNFGTLATVTATSGSVVGTGQVDVVSHPWTAGTVGGPAVAGPSFDDANGNYTVTGSGGNNFGTTDAMEFDRQTLVGDGTLVARVTSQQNTNAWAQAGVMIRNDLTSGSAKAFMAITPGHGALFQHRDAASLNTSYNNTVGRTAPYWVRLVRSGSTFSGYYSPDGANWTLEASATVTMVTTVYAGLAVTSYTDGVLSTATFDHVSLSTVKVSGVSSTLPNGNYGLGKAVPITVAFSSPVIVNTAGGTPSLALNDGGTAVYSGGSGTGTLTFTYVPTPGQSTAHLDLSSSAALTLNGSAIIDLGGNPALLPLPAPGAAGSLGANKTLAINGNVPTVLGLVASPSSGTLAAGASTTIGVIFSSPVIVNTAAGTPSLALNSLGVATYSGGTGSTTLTFSYVVAAGQNSARLDEASAGALSLRGGTIQDLFGNVATIGLPAPGTGGSLGANANLVINTGPPSATFLKTDTTTQGNWKGVYGADGYDIAQDPSGNNPALPAYANVTTTATPYTWNPATGDPQALQQSASGSTNRIASTWYAYGSFSFNVTLNDGNAHELALYLLDYDNAGRTETVQVSNGANVLDTQGVSGFSGGQYLVWGVTGNVTITVTQTGPANAVAAALFFGGVLQPAPPTAAATYLKTDTTTQGNWKGAYGAVGYDLAQDPSGGPSLPSYATVTPTGATGYTWNGATADPRALQQSAAGSTSRVASTWYNSNSFGLDVRLTDGSPHQIALYALDWDNIGRTETLQLIDDATGTVLDTRSLSGFQGGEYLVWSVTGNVTINVTNTGPGNAVAAALFFGAPTVVSPVATATYVRTDTTTQGSWKGAYGASGYDIARDPSGNNPTIPSFATVTPINATTYTWTGGNTTSNVRALQQSSAGSTNRVASTWYATNTFSLDVRLTDGSPHQIALYALDWDNIGRTETLQLIDDATGTVLDTRSLSGFQNGVYLVWNVTGDVTFKVTNTGPGNAVASGLFFG